MNKIAIRSYTNLKIVDLKDIIYCKADGRYTWIYLKNGEKLVSARILKDYESLLPQDSFLRIHKSCVINVNYISTYDKSNNGIITMDNGENLSIAKRRKKEFREKLAQLCVLI